MARTVTQGKRTFQVAQTHHISENTVIVHLQKFTSCY
ncbi:MAG: hypothetical protein IAF02_14095 [Anaerolineae bacterium]|nr:hypothetical protein [Anaerolineae bacterium]